MSNTGVIMYSQTNKFGTLADNEENIRPRYMDGKFDQNLNEISKKKRQVTKIRTHLLSQDDNPDLLNFLSFKKSFNDQHLTKTSSKSRGSKQHF